MEQGSGEHSVFTHFPKYQNCEICLKTKTTRASCRRRAGTVVPRAENLFDLIAADTKFLLKDVNCGTIIDMQSWYKIWQHSRYSHARVKQKLLKKPRRA